MCLAFGKLLAVGEHEFCDVGSQRRPGVGQSTVVLPAVGQPSVRRPLGRQSRRAPALAALCVLGWSLGACTPTALDTVDLGDNPEPPDLALDESFFHCEIQPNVITAQGCATGGTGEANSCHMARSALRLIQVPTPSLCQGGRLVGSASPESIVNFERVRTSVGIDADASPLYRRPLGLDSHPRTIFASDSPAAVLLRAWLDGQAAP
ncbi:MAG: hypothetical protein RLZZ450_361 [Pseudomonadota bacterium]